MAYIALIAGATGLVGAECLKLLLENKQYERVLAVSRRPLALQHPKLENLVCDFDKLGAQSAKLKADHVYCALGSTMAKAGSREAFRKSDFEYPLQIAKMAQQNGAQKFVLVSALGADARSLVFYSRVKGELEEAIGKLGYDTYVALRPSILLGDRNESRPGEAVAQWAAKKLPFLFSGPLAKYKGIAAGTVASAMVNCALQGSGEMLLENEQIFEKATFGYA